MVDNDLETDWIDVAAAGEHVCARRASGAVCCWGDNRHGELASDTGVVPLATTPRPIAIPSGVPATFAAIGVGYEHTCAIDDRQPSRADAGPGKLADRGGRGLDDLRDR